MHVHLAQSPSVAGRCRFSLCYILLFIVSQLSTLQNALWGKDLVNFRFLPQLISSSCGSYEIATSVQWCEEWQSHAHTWGFLSSVSGKWISRRWHAFWRFFVVTEMIRVLLLPASVEDLYLTSQSLRLDYLREEPCGWSNSSKTGQWFDLRGFQEFYGCLESSGQVLSCLKPLLSLRYARLAAFGKAATLWVSQLLASTFGFYLHFIKEKFIKGFCKVSCSLKQLELGKLFRTDSKVRDRVVSGSLVDWTPLRYLASTKISNTWQLHTSLLGRHRRQDGQYGH